MKYLSTIRHVFRKYHHWEVEEDCFVNNNNDSDTNENDSYRQYDLM